MLPMYSSLGMYLIINYYVYLTLDNVGADSIMFMLEMFLTLREVENKLTN